VVSEPGAAFILREFPDGRQWPIRVDVSHVMTDQKERILIQANDFVMLQFKPHQALANGLMNFFSFSIVNRLAASQ